MPESEVFFSYHTGDRAQVAEVKRVLEGRGVRVFLDTEGLVPGDLWCDKLERALAKATAVIAFLGSRGLGPWQKREVYFALQREIEEKSPGGRFRLIPVLLPGAEPKLGFLFQNQAVDLRDPTGSPAQLARLMALLEGGTDAEEQAKVMGFSPYPGLATFREEDAPFFFGRDAQADNLAQAVRAKAFITLVGPSGSGKSSLIQAGLFPRLRRGRHSRLAWEMALCQPGPDPFLNLADAMVAVIEPDLSPVDRERKSRELAGYMQVPEVERGAVWFAGFVERQFVTGRGTNCLLLVVDQFELLFTQTQETDRLRFLATLRLAQEKTEALHLLVSLRADFLHHALECPPIADRIRDLVVALPSIGRNELREVIVGPARRAHLTFRPEATLVERILDDVGEEPGNLPLLQFTLERLWEHRDGDALTSDAYDAVGPVHQTLAKTATETLERLDKPELAAAPRVFLGLVRVARPGRGELDTRSRLRWRDLDDVGRKVVRAFVKERLLTLGRDEAVREEYVEVAHEALIRHWTQLRDWVNTHREFLVWRDHLDEAVRAREAGGQSRAEVWNDVQLAASKAWYPLREAELTEDQRVFLRESFRAQWFRRMAWFSAVAAALILTTGAALYFRALSQISRARELVARANVELSRDPECGAVLAWKATELSWREGEDELRTALMASLLRARYEIPGRPKVLRLAYSPDGGTLVCACDDGRVSFLTSDGASGNLAFLHEIPAHTKAVECVVFAPDGRRVATAGHDEVCRIWDVATRRQLALLPHTNSVFDVAFGGGGGALATACRDGFVRVWRDGDGRRLAAFGGEVGSGFRSVAFSSDGLSLYAGDDKGFLYGWSTSNGWMSASSGKAFRWHGGSISSVTWVSGGAAPLLLTTGYDHMARLGEFGEGSTAQTFAGHPLQVFGGAVSPCGGFIATVGDNTAAFVFDLATARQIAFLSPHGASVRSVVFRPDGRFLATAGDDGSVRIWAVPYGRSLGAVAGGIRAIGIPPGRSVAEVFGDDGSLRAVALEAGGSASPVLTRSNVVAMSSLGSYLVHSEASGGSFEAWDATGKALGPVSGTASPDERPVLSPDGTRVLIRGSEAGELWLQNLKDRTRSRLPGNHPARIESAAFSPDNQLLFIAYAGTPPDLWTLPALKRQALTRVPPSAESLAFHPSGKWIALVPVDSPLAEVWDCERGVRSSELVGHEQKVNSAAFSGDGRFVVTSSGDRTARLWNWRTGRCLGELRGHSERLLVAVFVDGSKGVVTGSLDGRARYFDTPQLAEAGMLRPFALSRLAWRLAVGDCEDVPALRMPRRPNGESAR